jgi:hypothetical protein
VTWRVPSLELPAPGDALEPGRIAGLASVQLFLDRARAVAPGFVLDADTVGPVAEICIRLDGIPLAGQSRPRPHARAGERANLLLLGLFSAGSSSSSADGRSIRQCQLDVALGAVGAADGESDGVVGVVQA